MTNTERLGIALLRELGLQPWQAMVIQDQLNNPAQLRVFVFDPAVDLARLQACSKWRDLPVSFERSEAPSLH